MVDNNSEPYIHYQKRRADLGMQGPAQHSLKWILHPKDGLQLFRSILFVALVFLQFLTPDSALRPSVRIAFNVSTKIYSILK